MSDIVYVASKTGRLFHKDTSFVRAIMGPIGSGKSVTCIMEMLRLSRIQEPFNGVRKTRWCVVRNTYRELLDTTMATFFDWIPKSLGHFSAMNSTFVIDAKLEDGTKMHMEVLFRALDRPNDVKKLLSLELTGMFVNEAREVPKAIIDMGIGRLGRYPSKRDGGPSWYGLILDTNPCDNDHWWYKLFEETRPKGYVLFRQPGGLSAEAENIENLPVGYYDRMVHGKDAQWVEVYVHGEYGFVTEGKPVYPEYIDRVHWSNEEYVVDTGSTLYIGIDFGLTPAAVFGQKTSSGRVVIFDELVTFDMGAVSFGRLLKERLNTTYRDVKRIEIYADPAGQQRAQTDENTPFMILANQGINAYPTHTNDPEIRREVVAEYMGRLDMAGYPAFCLCGKADTLRKAHSGGYKLKRLQVTGEERYMDKPVKNKYSHVAEACQYLFLGAVGDERVIGGWGDMEMDYSVSNRGIV